VKTEGTDDTEGKGGERGKTKVAFFRFLSSEWAGCTSLHILSRHPQDRKFVYINTVE
jgi:hypothetical protein